MATEMENEKFKQGLIEDVASAQQMAQQSSAGRGAPEPSDFNPRSLRIKNRVVGQAELDKLNGTIEDAIKHYTSEAGFTDDVQAGQFSHGLRKKFNQYKLMVLRQAGQMAKEKAKHESDEAGKKALLSAIGGIVKNGASIAMGQIGKSSGAAKSVQTGVNAAGQGMASDQDWAGFTGANAATNNGIQTADDWSNWATKK